MLTLTFSHTSSLRLVHEPMVYVSELASFLAQEGLGFQATSSTRTPPSLFGYFYGHRVGSPSLVLHTREVRLSIRISQSPLSETVFGAFRCP